MVRLLTHNMLQCHVKNCNNGFPLRFDNPEIEISEQEINTDFLVNMLPRIHWPALRSTATELGLQELPESMPEDAATNQDFLQLLHRILMETAIKSGSMVCPNCEHVYPIRDGIPNMLLNEDEV
ncbi:hypothetical protein BCR44DRAFT_34699 [Catenaria anguillulae PL171]|uniref:Trm112p-domain-containing protein n=1 Tax=Catenaria anguillulae PL171 TaxID=765915 RepID=A0A1Y2HBW7_9FUNG|nr:hypothetical protein BCR44DRAFT_34699 [Catenaria anguillulae PL171]